MDYGADLLGQLKIIRPGNPEMVDRWITEVERLRAIEARARAYREAWNADRGVDSARGLLFSSLDGEA